MTTPSGPQNLPSLDVPQATVTPEATSITSAVPQPPKQQRQDIAVQILPTSTPPGLNRHPTIAPAQATPSSQHLEEDKVSIERLKIEIYLGTDDFDVATLHTKALVLFGKIVNEDPSRKLMPYKGTDEKNWKTLLKIHDLPPQTMASMRKYIADPRINPGTKRLVFYSRFSTIKPLGQLKQIPGFMEWLKKEKLWLTTSHITSTNNRRVGFFLAKCVSITNLAAFNKFVHNRIIGKLPDPPEFQINSNSAHWRDSRFH